MCDCTSHCKCSASRSASTCGHAGAVAPPPKNSPHDVGSDGRAATCSPWRRSPAPPSAISAARSYGLRHTTRVRRLRSAYRELGVPGGRWRGALRLHGSSRREINLENVGAPHLFSLALVRAEVMDSRSFAGHAMGDLKHPRRPSVAAREMDVSSEHLFQTIQRRCMLCSLLWSKRCNRFSLGQPSNTR